MTAPVFSDRDENRGPCFRCGTTWKRCDASGGGRCCDDCVQEYGATHPLLESAA